MEVAFLHQDPWGNSWRSYVDYKSGAEALKEIYRLKMSGELEEKILAPARAYAESRTWSACGDVLDAAVRSIFKPKEVLIPTIPSGLTPATVPQLIPIAEEDKDDGETI